MNNSNQNFRDDSDTIIFAVSDDVAPEILERFQVTENKKILSGQYNNVLRNFSADEFNRTKQLSAGERSSSLPPSPDHS